MNVREDKMTNHFGLKIISVFCVPVLFRLIRGAKGENILLNVMKWVVQLDNYKRDIRNSKRSLSKRVTYFMISDLFQDKV